MSHYDFHREFREIHQTAVERFKNGARRAEDLFEDPRATSWLSANGLTAQHLFDYAEDWANYQEPDFSLALAIELVRRDYFLNAQKAKASSKVLDESALPAKTDQARGIEWLPRLIPKALAKLRGELPRSLMYCCGGDRRFFKTHDIHPAEFLTLVWRHENDPAAIIDWVATRIATKNQAPTP